MILYAGIFIALVIILNPVFKIYLQRSRNKFSNVKYKVEQSKISKHIQRLLTITLQKSDPYAVFVFYLTSFALYLLSFLIIYKAELSIAQLLIIPIIVAAIPYITLWLRLYGIRIDSSYEGDVVVKAILNNYKINHKNMYEAIDNAILELPKHYFARLALKRLSLRLRGYKDFEELEEIVYDFNYSIDTSWSLDLSNAILIAIHQDYDVTPSLTDIQRKFKTLKEITEQQKRYNQEGYLIAKWLTPMIYVSTVLAMIYYLDFSFEDYIKRQFFHPLGLRFAIYTLLSMIVGYGLFFFTRKPKNDF